MSEKINLSLKKSTWKFLKEALWSVVNHKNGTGKLARLDGVDVFGKTGTAQNPHGKDHSIFIAFAPKNNPKIAIAVYVENGGWGSTWAAPIAGLMIQKYTKTLINENLENFILEGKISKQ